jgi:glycerol-3-phosphate acyltransferase PlsY
VLPALAIVIAYLIGGIPFGYLLLKVATGQDVRRSGSGNIGATNVFRSNRTVGLVTLLLDAVKGWVAVYIAALLTHHNDLWTSAAAIAVLVGHIYPVFLGFKGGKAVASFMGAFAYLTPIALVAVLLVFIVAVWRTKFISLGSILAAACFPIAVWIIERPPWPVVVASIIAFGLIIWRHRANIERLRAGNENVFSFRRARR